MSDEDRRWLEELFERVCKVFMVTGDYEDITKRRAAIPYLYRDKLKFVRCEYEGTNEWLMSGDDINEFSDFFEKLYDYLVFSRGDAIRYALEVSGPFINSNISKTQTQLLEWLETKKKEGLQVASYDFRYFRPTEWEAGAVGIIVRIKRDEPI